MIWDSVHYWKCLTKDCKLILIIVIAGSMVAHYHDILQMSLVLIFPLKHSDWFLYYYWCHFWIPKCPCAIMQEFSPWYYDHKCVVGNDYASDLSHSEQDDHWTRWTPHNINFEILLCSEKSFIDQITPSQTVVIVSILMAYFKCDI